MTDELATTALCLLKELVRLQGHDATKSITLAGGEQRDVTISAQKEPSNAA